MDGLGPKAQLRNARQIIRYEDLVDILPGSAGRAVALAPSQNPPCDLNKISTFWTSMKRGISMKRAVRYLSVSTTDQTTANQERELREVVSRMGCEIVRVRIVGQRSQRFA